MARVPVLPGERMTPLPSTPAVAGDRRPHRRAGLPVDAWPLQRDATGCSLEVQSPIHL